MASRRAPRRLLFNLDRKSPPEPGNFVHSKNTLASRSSKASCVGNRGRLVISLSWFCRRCGLSTASRFETYRRTRVCTYIMHCVHTAKHGSAGLVATIRCVCIICARGAPRRIEQTEKNYRLELGRTCKYRSDGNNRISTVQLFCSTCKNDPRFFDHFKKGA